MNFKDTNPITDFKNEMFNKTMHYQKQYGFEYNRNDKEHATWNNEADAFKHAFMQAVGSFRYGRGGSALGGWSHEVKGNVSHKQPQGERNMDDWNNRVGRDIADEIKDMIKNTGAKLTDKQKEDIAAFKIMQRMRNGDLITHPNDKRKFEDYDRIMGKKRATGYAIPVSNAALNEPKKFYALEDVGKMTSEEFSNIEETINRQIGEGTMKNKAYFEGEVHSGNMTWVDSYARSDGTKVSGYYRSTK